MRPTRKTRSGDPASSPMSFLHLLPFVIIPFLSLPTGTEAQTMGAMVLSLRWGRMPQAG